ncbi:DMT family transporter [Palleronia sp. KMU-117]|uniref:DMT family transporter n=1 Tax=Palleronia sp. KMU-117 TaxID=3434108 RepID=UPI003D726DFC
MTSFDPIRVVDRDELETADVGGGDLCPRTPEIDVGRPDHADPTGSRHQEKSSKQTLGHGRASSTARALGLVLLAGVLFGASPAIGRVSAGIGLPPLGLVLWSNVLAATVCLTWTCARTGLPRLTRSDLGFVLGWAFILGCLYQSLTIVIAGQVDASVIALVNSSRGFLVFLLAAVLMLETPSLRRFLGLGLGFVAVAGLLTTDASVQGVPPFWLVACLSLPALLALHTVIMGSRRTSLGAFAAVGAMMSVSSLLLLPIAFATDAIFVPWQAPGIGVLLIVALGLSTALALVLALVLVRSSGPVFAGQMAYSQTIGGLVWSFVILDERLSPLAWGAVAVLFAGVWIVAPRPSPGTQVRQSIGGTHPRTGGASQASSTILSTEPPLNQGGRLSGNRRAFAGRVGGRPP